MGRFGHSAALAAVAIVLVFSGCRRKQDSQSRIELLSMARTYAARGDVDRALDFYRKALDATETNRGRIAIEAAAFCQAHSLPDGAILFADHVPEDSPERQTADELLVRALLGKKDWDRLGALLDGRWQRAESRLWAGPYLAEFKASQGKRDEAMAIYATLIDEMPTKREDWHLARVRLLLTAKQEAAAKAELNQMLAEDPRCVPALVGLGVLAAKERDWANARSAFGRAREIDAGDTEAVLGLAFAEISSGHLDPGKSLYAELLRRERPPYRKLYPYLDMLGQESAVDAIAAVAAAVKPAPDPSGDDGGASAFLAYANGLVAVLRGDGQTALDRFREALAADSDKAPARVRVRIADLLLDRGEVDEATKMMELAQASGEDSRQGALVQAKLAFHAGDFSGCLRWARTVGSADPAAARLMALSCANLDQFDQARRYLQRQPTPVEAAPAMGLVMADCLEATGELDRAKATLEKVAETGAGQPVEDLARAKLALIGGDYDSAAKALSELQDRVTGQAWKSVSVLRLRLALVRQDTALAAKILAELDADGPCPGLELFRGWLAALNDQLTDAIPLLAASEDSQGWDALIRNMLLGICQLVTGHPAQAADRFDQAAAAVRNPPPLLLDLAARAYWQAGDAATAVTRGEAYLKANPSDGRALIRLARACCDSGKPAKAVSLLQEACSRAPQDRVLGLALVQALLANLQVDEAGRQADELRRQFPEDWQVCLALAEVLLTRRDSQRLTQLLAGIAKGQPGFDQARYLLAMDRVLSRQFAAALRLLDESGEKGYRLGLARAFALANLGRQPEAAELCRTLIRDQPKAQEAYFLLSEVQVATGQTELAIETLRKCLVLGEAFVPALNNLAWLLAQDKNRLPEAVNCIRKAVRLTPGSAAVLDTQARVELQAGNPEQALRAAQAAIEQRPGFWPYYHAAVAAYRSNQLATDFLQKAKELATTKAQEQLLAQWPQTPIEGTAR